MKKKQNHNIVACWDVVWQIELLLALQHEKSRLTFRKDPTLQSKSKD